MITDPPLIKLKNSRVQKFTKKKDNNASTISMTPLSSIALAQISSIASAQDKGRRQMITDPPLIKLKNSRFQKFT